MKMLEKRMNALRVKSELTSSKATFPLTFNSKSSNTDFKPNNPEDTLCPTPRLGIQKHYWTKEEVIS
jgi:hypothetical protein